MKADKVIELLVQVTQQSEKEPPLSQLAPDLCDILMLSQDKLGVDRQQVLLAGLLFGYILRGMVEREEVIL